MKALQVKRLYRQNKTSGMMCPVPEEDLRALSLQGLSGFSIKPETDTLLVPLPSSSRIGCVTLCFVFNKPIRVDTLLYGSHDTTDGVDGVWSRLSDRTSVGVENHISLENTWHDKLAAFRWLKLEFVPQSGVSELHIAHLRIEGESAHDKLMVCNEDGSQIQNLDVGEVEAGGETRIPFYVKNTYNKRVAIRIVLENDNPNIKDRIWLVGVSGLCRALELGYLDPGQKVGPIWVSGTPKELDKVQAYKSWLRVIPREVFNED